MNDSSFGRLAPAPRLTRPGAALLALAVAVPGGCLIWLVAAFAG